MSTAALSSYQRGSSSLGVVLYDPECTLEIDSEMARGFLVLLTGSPGDASNLGFLSLTDGNIVDACMGSHAQKREGVQFEAARNAKIALANAADTSEAIQELAIQSYKKAFETVINYHEKTSKVWCCMRCCVYSRMRRRATRRLERNFRMLHEAVRSSQ